MAQIVKAALQGADLTRPRAEPAWIVGAFVGLVVLFLLLALAQNASTRIGGLIGSLTGTNVSGTPPGFASFLGA